MYPLRAVWVIAIYLLPRPNYLLSIAHGFWHKARTLSELSTHLPTAGYELAVRFQKPLLLPGAGSVHMRGSWQAIV
jgi:hypothetical protein